MFEPPCTSVHQVICESVLVELRAQRPQCSLHCHLLEPFGCKFAALGA